MSEVGVTFKYRIGDVVAGVLHLEELRKFMDATFLQMRPDTMRVEERMSVECIGGTQLFYSCRCRDGAVNKYDEASLINAEVLWDAWIDGINKQDTKKAKP